MGLVVAYLWEPFHRVAAAHPRVSVRAYVDDAQLQVVGPPATVVETLHAAGVALLDELEGPLRLRANRDKTAIVGSCKAHVRIIRRLFGAAADASPGPSVRNLGCDFGLLTARSAPGAGGVRKARFLKVQRRGQRLALLKAAGLRRAHRIFATGLLPAVGYGAEVTGFSPTELRRVVALGLKTVSPSNRGASRAVRLALSEAALTDRLAVAALHRFSSEVWDALRGAPTAMPLSDLSAGWRVISGFGGTWRSAAGPLHVAALELRRVGWTPNPARPHSARRPLHHARQHAPRPRPAALLA